MTDVRQLPHAYPFVLLDRVLMVEPDGWAVALKGVARNEALVGEDGALPPVLLCEMMAQAAGLAVASRAPHAAAMLAAVDRFRCRRCPPTGGQLLVAARVLRRIGPNIKARAVVCADGRVWAAGDLVLHLVPALTRP